MSGITNGAQRASRQGPEPLALGLPRKNRHTGAVVAAILFGITMVISQLFVRPTIDSADAATAPVLVSVETLRTKPTSGAAWNGLKSIADQAVGTLTLSDQDESSDITVLAKALVYARTGTAAYRSAVVAALKSAVGTESGGRTLALGRNLPSLVIAADLISLRTADPSFDSDRFRPWLKSLLTKVLDEQTLISTHEMRPNNWGAHAGAARVAVAKYLGDTTQLARAAAVFHGWVGARAAYAGFRFGDDLSWHCDPTKPVGINPAGCMKGSVVVDGAIPDDMRRGGSFKWPPAQTNYAWENLQGTILQAELLRTAGYDSFNWESKAILRAVKFLYDRARWTATGDDEWITWLVDARYGTSYKLSPPVRFGKNFGFTDWIYGPGGGGGDVVGVPAPNPTATPKPTATPAPTPTPAPVSGTASVGATAPSSRIVGATTFQAGTLPLVTSWALKGTTSDLNRYELQQSIDGGSYRGVGLSSATAKSAIVAVPTGKKVTYRVRAWDDAGRASAWVTGPTFATGAAAESAAKYSGAWVSAGHASYLGGTALASKAAGAHATFTYSGRSFGLIGPVGPTRGKATIYLDGNALLTIDTYASTFQARRVIQTIFTPDGNHTVTIKVLGTSGRPWVAIDGFFTLTRQ